VEDVTPVTIITTDVHESAAAVTDDDFLLDPSTLRAATGWALKPEGLCRGDTCVPVADRSTLVHEDKVSLSGVASNVGLLAVVDPSTGIAALTERASQSSQPLRTGVAPPFSVPDLHGRPVSLADFAGKKKLLVAWASW